jgi:hypothetical protein
MKMRLGCGALLCFFGGFVAGVTSGLLPYLLGLAIFVFGILILSASEE